MGEVEITYLRIRTCWWNSPSLVMHTPCAVEQAQAPLEMLHCICVASLTSQLETFTAPIWAQETQWSGSFAIAPKRSNMGVQPSPSTKGNPCTFPASPTLLNSSLNMFCVAPGGMPPTHNLDRVRKPRLRRKENRKTQLWLSSKLARIVGTWPHLQRPASASFVRILGGEWYSEFVTEVTIIRCVSCM